MIRIGIDASNISSGGGVTHLCEILKALDLDATGIKSVDVWSNKNTLSKIEKRNNIHPRHHPNLEGNLLKRFYWQTKELTKIAKDQYDVLYVPGGSYLGSFRPVVTMNRNLLPFDHEERSRYWPSFQSLRMVSLEKMQSYTYQLADGLIFLSEEAKRVTEKTIGKKFSRTTIIPHGIASKFFEKPRDQKPIKNYDQQHSFKFLYVSTITVYKHQWHVIKAMHMLREKGYPVTLDLVGKITTQKGKKLFDEAKRMYDPDDEFIHFHGSKSQNELLGFYKKADSFIFASSCETFGQILLESMASGLPIACSNRSAMPEILKEAGLYFDPENPKSIAEVLQKLLDAADLRQKMANDAYQIAQTYSWEKCANRTFNFIRLVFEEVRA